MKKFLKKHYLLLFSLVLIFNLNINIVKANFGISPSISVVEIEPDKTLSTSISILRSGKELEKDVIMKVRNSNKSINLSSEEIILKKGEKSFKYDYSVNSDNLKVGNTYEDIIYFTPELDTILDSTGNKINLAIGGKIRLTVREKQILPTDYSIEKEKNKNIDFKIINPNAFYSQNVNSVFQIRLINNSDHQVKNIPYSFEVSCNNHIINKSNNLHSGTLNPGEEATITQNHTFSKKGDCSVSFNNEYNEKNANVKIYSKFQFWLVNLWNKITK